jgi:hypothetical protein
VIFMSIGAYLEPPIIKTAGGTQQLDALEAGSLIVAAYAGTSSFRLPPITSPEQDFRFTFLNTVDQNMAILPPSTAGYVGASTTLGTLNNLAAASVTFSTSSQKIGAVATARSIQGKWWVSNNSDAMTATVA